MTWQEIETAPKDGTAVLLWDADLEDAPHYEPVIGHFVDFESVGGAPDGYHSGWYDNVSGRVELRPTHWMPLPDPPVMERER